MMEPKVGTATASDKAPSVLSGSTMGAKDAAVPKPPVNEVDPSITAKDGLKCIMRAIVCAVTFCKIAKTTAAAKNTKTFFPPSFKMENPALYPTEVKNITIQ